MKKTILYAICGLIGASAGIGLYGWRQATYVPTEYQLSGADLEQEALSVDQLLSQKLDLRLEGSEVTLDETEVSQLLAQGLVAQSRSKDLLQAVRGIDTSIKADRVETGVVMNLSELPREALPSEMQQAIARLEQTLPVLMERDVYISIAGRPQVDSGRLVFDREASIQIGRLQIPLVDLAEQVGIAPGELEESLGNYLNQSGINLENIDLKDGQIVLDVQS